MRQNKLVFRVVVYLMIASMLLTTIVFTINTFF